jgi:hypothetical protein
LLRSKEFGVVVMTIGSGEPAQRQPMPPHAGSRTAANSDVVDLAADPLAWIPPSAR